MCMFVVPFSPAPRGATLPKVPTMPSPFHQIESAFRSAISGALGIDADPVVTPSQNEKFGDYQSNAAMGLVRTLSDHTGTKQNPRQIAEQIKSAVTPLLAEVADEITIAGPGFINVRLKPAWLSRQLSQMAADASLGIERADQPMRIVVDYSAPNVAKEMHVGHLRTTIIGDCFVRVLEALGHHPEPQNHLGDWGTQFGMLITYLADHVTGISSSDPNISATSFGVEGDQSKRTLFIKDMEQFYREAKAKFDADPAFAARSREAVVRLQAGGVQEITYWREIVDTTRRYIDQVYRRLSVRLTPEHECGESFYNPFLPAVVAELLEKRIAEISDGAAIVRVPGYEAPLIIRKSDGGYGYATTDLAAVRYRARELHANRCIYVVGLPQSEHFAKVFWAAKQAGWATDVSLEHAGFGSVLGPDGKIFRTRAGGTVKLAELLDEAVERARALVDAKSPDLPDAERAEIARAVGIGAVKYFDLARDRVGDYIFSFDAMLSMDGNTAPYLQYAHARIRSIFRRVQDETGDATIGETHVVEPAEIALAKHLLRFGDTVAGVARDLKPHVLCTYLYDLATAFSRFYESCPVLKSDPPTRAQRLALCDLTARTLSTGLALLGIETPQRM